uniref:Carbohydrate sulfotransferase n=1 Tax=Oryzias latipes TaxID=8090 RepID=A0A3B3IHD4_ORYLA
RLALPHPPKQLSSVLYPPLQCLVGSPLPSYQSGSGSPPGSLPSHSLPPSEVFPILTMGFPVHILHTCFCILFQPLDCGTPCMLSLPASYTLQLCLSIALVQNEPYPDPMSFKDNWVHKFDRFQLLKHYSMPERKKTDVYSFISQAKLRQYTKFLFVRDPFVRLISAYRDKMQHYDQYFYEGYIRVILQRYKNQKDVPVKYNGTKKTYLKPSFHNFVQYIVDPRSEKYAPFEPHWRQMHRLCHPCLVEYDFVGHQESLQEDAQQLLKILKLENAITFPPSYENIKAIRKDLYKIYEKDFQLFGYRRPTELLDD